MYECMQTERDGFDQVGNERAVENLFPLISDTACNSKTYKGPDVFKNVIDLTSHSNSFLNHYVIYAMRLT